MGNKSRLVSFTNGKSVKKIAANKRGLRGSEKLFLFNLRSSAKSAANFFNFC